MNTPAFLRSINLELDASDPARFSHFQPTSKSADLLDEVLSPSGDRALLVVAPYGSGKSLTAGFLLHSVQNDPQRFHGAGELCFTVADRLAAVRPEVAERVAQRARSEGQRGVVATMYGFQGRVVDGLRTSLVEGFRRLGLGRQARSIETLEGVDGSAASDLLQTAADKLSRAGCDHLLIVWDEFGRQLEGMIEHGIASDLVNLQVMAEAASRISSVKVTLLLLLHRGFAGYASALPTNTRKEWSKIEGRFRVKQFVDDSAEAYRLLADVVRESHTAKRGGSQLDTDEATERLLLELASQGQIFEDQADPAALLKSAMPIEPCTLWLLPRVSARVAQNERTAFSFIADMLITEPVGPDALYDYFRGEFQADTGPGGTHRAWLEAESALAKLAADSLEAKVIKAAFLLNLGLGGERTRATQDRLIAAARGLTRSAAEVQEAVTRLLQSKLLIHRAHSDHVLVWHGTDVDLRGRLEDERARSARDLDLVSFIGREAPPPIWRPSRHNAETGVNRFLQSRYVGLSGLVSYQDDVVFGLRERGIDGEVIYVLPATDTERLEALQIVARLKDERSVFAIAPPTQDLRETAEDLAALLRMQRDSELIAQDPLVKKELDQLTDDVRAALTRPVARLLDPAGICEWFHAGEPVQFSDKVQFRQFLSDVMDNLFRLTPTIRSEMVVRRRPTPVIVNARKKVVLGILERSSLADLGIEGDFADKAIFRSVLLTTGLFQNTPTPHFSFPEELSKKGLRAVWEEIRDFLTSPKEQVSFQSLFDKLREPPFGVREGLFPILLAAGLKAFPTSVAIRSRSTYITDILPSAIEDIVRSPEDFTLTVFGLSKAQEVFLTRLFEEFNDDPVSTGHESGDLIRRVYDAVQTWWSGLPDAAFTSSRLSSDARALRRLLKAEDPAQSLLSELPRTFGGDRCDLEEALDRVITAKSELADVHRKFVEEAKLELARALQLRGLDTAEGLLPAAKAWGELFPPQSPVPGLSRLEKGFISQMRRSHETEDRLLDALAMVLVGKAFRTWDDTVVFQFSRSIRAYFDNIEQAAIQTVLQGKDDSQQLVDSMASLAQARAVKLFEDLAELTGVSQAQTIFGKVAQQAQQRKRTVK